MATSIIKLHTLSGTGDNGSPCYLLQVDEFHCLLDCGWCEKLDSDYVKEVSKWAKHVDAVLLSHQSLRHLGLLPYLVGTCGLNCPVYATTPVYKMGQMFLYDFFQSRHASENFSHYTLDDVDLAFDHVHQVKYQQTISLHGRGHGLCITPLPSGHTLGGTIWKLVKEDTSIVYALDFNHKKERHLNGATFDACIRPHLLIIDGSNTLYTQPRRKDRDENLRQTILKSLRRGGNVLIAVDTAGRCLEVAHFLEQCWLNQESGLMAYGLAMLNYVALNVVDFAKSMVEWMSEKVMRSFEDQRSNPFHFRHMQLCHTLEQLDAVSEPKVVLSSLSDLSCGFSRQLFAEWADNDLNTVILTSQESVITGVGESSSQSLISRLIGLARKDNDARKDLPTSSTGTSILPLTLSQRVSCSQADQSGSDIPHLKNSAKGFSFSQNTNSAISDACDELNSETEPGNSYTDIPIPSAGDITHSDVSPQITEGILEKQPSCDSELENESTCCSNRPYGSEEGTHVEKSKSLSLTLSVPRDHSKKTIVPSNTTRLFPKTSLPLNMEQFGVTNLHLTSGRHQAGYDIYPGLHNQAGGQFFRVAKRTQLLFPQNEKKIHWDEYGAHLDPELFTSTEPVSSQAALPNWDIKNTKPNSDIVSSGFSSTSILDYLVARTPTFDVLDSNTRCVTHHLEIPLRCEVVFLDYEGRSDGEAMKRILIGLRPQEIILVGNNAPAIDHLANYCRGVMLLDPNYIHIPHPREIVNCTKEGDIYQARMKDSLVSSLKFTKIRDYELAWVEATVSLDDKSDYHIKEKNNNNAENNGNDDNDDVEMSTGNNLELRSRTPLAADQLPVLSLPTGPIGQHKTVFVNEPKLSDLKQLLLSQGLMAEFVSGILVVDNCVAIKRSEAGKLLLEGLLCGTYFEVRRILYQQFAIL
ncbi:cleavage and polyadenylation specificity factor subunit 2, variant 2 [Schistosoma haematobium]|uniref:Cleavage and polyadenylation specificity factor subunit 2 n=1 Tax=Schistosoma haematobium TaxID=6185 RepID=A0A922LWL8_SCHHA|nr:cleavage and polyadenylation specificity factor subunit 2, variant 2 [Schistosoma haematobium]KAH9594952.1 cleavage and polyadenylation specificity factor subunit 2, variant 2 [Schistosoma haematobium]